MGTTALLPLLAVAFVVSSAFGDFDVPTTADYYNSSGAPRWNDSAVDYTTPEPAPKTSPVHNHTTRAPRPDKTVTGAPIPDSENYYRQTFCGRKFNDDGVAGRQLSGGQAPWIVAVSYFRMAYGGGRRDKDYETAFAISDRHIVTSSDVFMGRKYKLNFLKWLITNEDVDMTKCKDRVMKVPTSFSNTIRVFNCGNLTRGESCPGSEVPNTVISAHFIGDCSGATSGLVVMEVEKPFDLDVVYPICVPDQPISRRSQYLVSYGIDKTSGNGTLTWDKLQTVRCRSGTSRNSICTRGSFCKAGFPLTNFNGNQEYAVAVSTKESCSKKQSEHISFAEFYPEIGRVTGIRNVKHLKHPTTSPPEVVARNRSSTVDYGRPSNNGSHY